MTDLAAGNDGIGAAPQPRWRRIIAWSALAEAVAAEGERRILWLPVWFGTGIALYFGIMAQTPPNQRFQRPAAQRSLRCPASQFRSREAAA